MESHGLYMKVRGFLIQDHLLPKKKKKQPTSKLFADLLVPVEVDWGYQYFSSVNNEFLSESWEGCAEQWYLVVFSFPCMYMVLFSPVSCILACSVPLTTH